MKVGAGVVLAAGGGAGAALLPPDASSVISSHFQVLPSSASGTLGSQAVLQLAQYSFLRKHFISPLWQHPVLLQSAPALVHLFFLTLQLQTSGSPPEPGVQLLLQLAKYSFFSKHLKAWSWQQVDFVHSWPLGEHLEDTLAASISQVHFEPSSASTFSGSQVYLQLAQY